ncbi:sentrin-specific protease 7 isoform X5 [Neopelma chrysocephalum]|uniref:sentrin-specific protease 7 isoform X5 n=1 Tax=Neopelma chrysocephalum TaxID=114329 RepID=UPI000FCD4721|nr:sentrin-specific protease 7 isoform X5 [Neopelma chrysocephalum]
MSAYTRVCVELVTFYLGKGKFPWITVFSDSNYFPNAGSISAKFHIPKKKTNTESEAVQVQSPVARLPGSHHWDYLFKEWRLSANYRKPSTKGRRQKDCDGHSSNDEESVGQPKVILTNILRTKIGRKYVDNHVTIDANLPAADKLQSGQLPSSSVASLQTCQILSSPHESSFLSERSERCLRKADDELCKLTKSSTEPGKTNAVTLRRRELQKKDAENKHYDELEKKGRQMTSTTLSQKDLGSFASEKRKRRHSDHISDDCNAHIPEKSLVLSEKQSLSSTPGCKTPCEDRQDDRSNTVLVLDCIPQPLERDCKDTSTRNHLRPAHSRTEESGSESPPRKLSEKQLSATSEDVILPRVSTIRKLKMDPSQYLSKLRNRICRGNQQLVSVDPIVLSSDDEDSPSEPQCTELMHDSITEIKETDQQSEFSAKQLEDKMESHTEQFVRESIEDKSLITLPSERTPRKQMSPSLDVTFDSLYIGRFKCLSRGPARFTTKNIEIPLQVALNKNIKLTVDTLDLRRFGLWRSDGGSSSTSIIFLWLSVDYVENMETQLGKLVVSKPSKPGEFVFLELSQPLTEWEENRLTELITSVSKKNRAPDLTEFLSLKEAFPLFKDLSPEKSSFMSYHKDLLKQYMPKKNTSDAHEPAVQKSNLKVVRPSYALANKQNSGCYSISLSSALNEEWKEVRETGAVKNLIVYPPPPAKGGLGVTREDLECLEYGEFLNDVIIDFYLKYLLLEKAPKRLADRTHIFSSFFYKCLTRTEKTSEGDVKVSVAQRRHRRVRTWTRRINIFSKDYIFVPVNEESHWYIAVICFPWLEEAVYEDCPHQNSLSHQSPLRSESENTRPGSVFFKGEEEMDSNRILFAKGGNEIAAAASVLDSAISKISLSNSKRQICKRPCILIFDSLKAGSVQKTVQVLREYLEMEWEAKRKTHREFSKSTMIDLCPRVPKQDNSSDCGVYLLQYVESFFQNPIVNFEEPLHLEDWFPRQLIRSKREEIRDLILQLHFQQHSGSSS